MKLTDDYCLQLDEQELENIRDGLIKQGYYSSRTKFNSALKAGAIRVMLVECIVKAGKRNFLRIKWDKEE